MLRFKNVAFVFPIAIMTIVPQDFGQATVPTALTTPTVIKAGWQCLLTPSAFDGPGTLFSVSADGTKSRIVDLEKLKLVTVHREPSTLAAITSDKKVEGSVALNLLEKLVPGLGAKITGGGHSINVSRVAYEKVEEETTFDSELKPGLSKWMAKNAREFMPHEDGTRYFIVRDAYKVGFVDYHFSKDSLIQFGGEASFKQVVSASASFTRGADSSYDIKQAFAPPLRVCVRTFEIGSTRGASGEHGYRIRPEDGKVPAILSESTKSVPSQNAPN